MALIGLAAVAAGGRAGGDDARTIDRDRQSEPNRGARIAAGADWPRVPNSSFEWQLVPPWSTARSAEVYDIDLLQAVPSRRRVEVSGFGGYTIPRGENAGAIADLHREGRFVICYVDTGAWESYWPDARLFPDRVKGRDTGWRGERWLDVRRRSWRLFAPLIWARLNLARDLGCDAVEGDQNNGAENRDGFAVTKKAMVRWYREVFERTHARGMAAVQKNGISRIGPLLNAPGDRRAREPDALLIEECAQFHECRRLAAWEKARKPVFQAEYLPQVSEGTFERRVCPNALAHGRFALLKREPPDGGYRRVC